MEEQPGTVDRAPRLTRQRRANGFCIVARCVEAGQDRTRIIGRNCQETRHILRREGMLGKTKRFISIEHFHRAQPRGVSRWTCGKRIEPERCLHQTRGEFSALDIATQPVKA